MLEFTPYGVFGLMADIVGKYGVQVQAVLKKAAGLDIETVCSLHGPVLHKEQLADVLAAYDTWSASVSYTHLTLPTT